jgi:mycothiol synthase
VSDSAPARAAFDVVAFEVGDEAALAAHLEIRNAVTPDNPDSPESVRWETATYPGQVFRFLALDGAGTPVGTASTGRIWMHEATYERYWLGLWVLPAVRRRGIGDALYRAVSAEARAQGKTGFQTELSEAHPDGDAFLAHRGFVEVDRSKQVRLELGGLAVPAPSLPAGLALTTLEARPDLVPSVHRVAVEAFPDIPTGDQAVAALSLDAFRARDIDRPDVPPGAFAIAFDEATGEVAGYANLRFAPGSSTVAWHDMTAVRPAYRGRGLALALKEATIAWAIAHGLDSLETGNDELNAPMRAVNARLGYRPIPDSIGLQGPLAGGRAILRP